MSAAVVIPERMRAIAIDTFGCPGEATVHGVPTPKPGPGELLVRVAAVGVNPADWKALMGWLPFVGTAMPLVTGFDGAGTVAALGEGVHGLAVGDRVGFMSSIALGRGGSYAEFAICLADHAARLPDGVSIAEAATAPVAGISAREALVSQGRVASGEAVFINGGSGGTGLWGVQIARAAGARVAATAGPANQSLLAAFGVECSIDYRSDDVATRLREWAPDGVDLVLDTVGQGSLSDPAALLRKGGRYLAIETMLPDEALPDAARMDECGVTALRVSASWERLGLHLSALYQAMVRGAMRALPFAELPATHAGEALERVRTGHVSGKLVLSLASDSDWAMPAAQPEEPVA
ncbi:MAG: hypothetical protein RIS94_1134 [Pseudomonadota bacterium]